MRGVVLLLAAGEGTRLASDRPKALAEVAGTPLVRLAALAIDQANLVDAIVVAAHRSVLEEVRAEMSDISKSVTVVAGGSCRQSSASAALDAAPDAPATLVHDAARPLARPALFDAVLRELDTFEAVCPALPVRDTIKEVNEDQVSRTLDRTTLVAAQTPQGFRTALYRRAHEQAAADGYTGTDDASLVERIGARLRLIPGDERNIKITTKHDLETASILLRSGR